MWTLDRNQGAVEPFEFAHVCKGPPEVRFVGLLAGGVDDKEEVITAMGDHKIVEDAAGVVGEQRIALTAGIESQNIDGHQPFKCKRGIGQPSRFRAESKLTHV